jgi:hypothetical protein
MVLLGTQLFFSKAGHTAGPGAAVWLSSACAKQNCGLLYRHKVLLFRRPDEVAAFLD